MTFLRFIPWLLVTLAAALRPDLGDGIFTRFERLLTRFARQRVASWILMGLLVLLLRGVLLPLWPIPNPCIYDEFGYLLQADTFASGRLTNPPHPLWHFFESPYILQQPSYTAKFPPGQGLIMALGQVIFGHAWFGVWLSCGALMAALCWALQGWLPAPWALLGAILAVPLCISSYWMNSYWGGAVAAIGGALVLGAYPRIVRRRQQAYAWLLGVGIVLLAMTRMYEGLLFVIPVLIALCRHARSVRVWTRVATVVVLGGSFLLFYNYRVTGRALQLPYVEYQRQYGYAPSFNFLPLNPSIKYRHTSLANHFLVWEYDRWDWSRQSRLFSERLKEWYKAFVILFNEAAILLMLLALLPLIALDKRMRLPIVAVGVIILGSFLQIVYYAHYAAPATVAFFILLAQSFRHLHRWQWRGKAIGRFLCRTIPVVFLLLFLKTEGTRIARQEPSGGTALWVNSQRDKIVNHLSDISDKRHLIIVRYTKEKTPHEEWVYNRADIDGANVVWAHDMGAVENLKLIRYFRDREIWLFEPDDNPVVFVPYERS